MAAAMAAARPAGAGLTENGSQMLHAEQKR